MLFSIFLLNLFLGIARAGAEDSPKLGLEDLESWVEKVVEKRLKDMEERMKKEKEEMDKRERDLEASTAKLRMEVEKLREVISSNFSNNALRNPAPRDLPIVFISAWQPGSFGSPQTVTYESFLANFNNGDRPGGGDGVLDLYSEMQKAGSMGVPIRGAPSMGRPAAQVLIFSSVMLILGSV